MWSETAEKWFLKFIWSSYEASADWLRKIPLNWLIQAAVNMKTDFKSKKCVFILWMGTAKFNPSTSKLLQPVLVYYFHHQIIITSSSSALNAGAPQGCVLTPLQFTLYTHVCTTRHHEDSTVKYVDDTTIIRGTMNNIKSSYQEEINNLAERCTENHQLLNVSNTKELTVDFRKKGGKDTHPSLHQWSWGADQEQPQENSCSSSLEKAQVTEPVTEEASTWAGAKF